MFEAHGQSCLLPLPSPHVLYISSNAFSNSAQVSPYLYEIRCSHGGKDVDVAVVGCNAV
jgi:hypothetical protein